MRSLACLFIAALSFAVGSRAEAGTATTSFRLQAVQSREIYGPFTFKTDSKLKIESGIFRLKIVGEKTFRLGDSDTGKTYGVYELVTGRMIDVGDVLFTIIGVETIASPLVAVARTGTASEASTSFFSGTALGLQLELLDTVKYKWEINGADADSEEKMERTSASLNIRKSYFTAQLGLVTAADWDNTITGDGVTFENATMEEGTGWLVGVGVDVPVFKEGRWNASVFGNASFRQEELSLQYGAWEVQSIVSTTVTNGTSNVVTTTTNLDYVNHDRDATLTETLVTLGATLAYEAPRWFLYTGLKTLPWADTSLDATIVAGDSKYKIEFERKDPVMVYGGIGFTLGGIKCYVEAEGGGETAIRLGLLKEL